jgi:hypothetical protein
MTFRELVKKDAEQIINSFKWLFVFSCFLEVIIFGIIYYSDGIIELDDIYLVFGIGLGVPFFFVGLAILQMYIDYFYWNRNFKSFPFNQLEQNGFERILKNEHSYNSSLSECFLGQVDEYSVEFDVDGQTESDKIIARFFIEERTFEKQKLKEIVKKLKEQNAFLDFNSIVKKYHYKKHQLKSFDELSEDLKLFADLLREIGFKNV